MWGAIAAAAASVAAAATNAIKNAKSRSAQRKNLAQDWDEYRRTANRLRNRSLMENKGYQYAMSRTGETLQRQNAQADAMAATGAISQEQANSLKEKNNAALTQAEQPFVNQEETIREFNENLLDKQRSALQGRSDKITEQSIADKNAATSQLISAMGTAASAIDGATGKKNKAKEDGGNNTSTEDTDTDVVDSNGVIHNVEEPTSSELGMYQEFVRNQPSRSATKSIAAASKEAERSDATAKNSQLNPQVQERMRAAHESGLNTTGVGAGFNQIVNMNYKPGPIDASKIDRTSSDSPQAIKKQTTPSENIYKKGYTSTPYMGVNLSALRYNTDEDGAVRGWKSWATT